MGIRVEPPDRNVETRNLILFWCFFYPYELPASRRRAVSASRGGRIFTNILIDSLLNNSAFAQNHPNDSGMISS